MAEVDAGLTLVQAATIMDILDQAMDELPLDGNEKAVLKRGMDRIEKGIDDAFEAMGGCEGGL